MKRLLFALLLLGGIARAQPVRYGASLRLIPQSSAPVNLTGNVGLWANSSNSNHPTLHFSGADYDLLYTLGGLSVSTTVPGSNQALMWNSGASQWQPVTVAIDSLTVHLAGTETVTGQKTFSLLPTLPAQTANTFWRGPGSGGATAPTFGQLVFGDFSAASLIGSGASQVPPGNDSRFLPAPSSSGAVYVFSDSGSAYSKTEIYPAVSGEVGITNKLYPVGDVRRYGAVADGVITTSGGAYVVSSGTDNRAAIQNAITSANAVATVSGGQAVVTLGCGTYVVGPSGSSAFSLYGLSNVTVQGQGPCTSLFFNTSAGGPFTGHTSIGASGYWTDFTSLGSFSLPWQDYPHSGLSTSNTIALGSKTITANPTGQFATVQAGDWIEVIEGNWDVGLVHKWDYKVERAQVASISGDTITLTAGVDIDFSNTSGEGVGIFRITPVVDFWIKGLTIQGTSQTYGPFFQTTVRGGMDSVQVDSFGWTNGIWYANNTHQWTMDRTVVNNSVFAGFNRASHGTVKRSKFTSIGAHAIEFGQGEMFTHWIDNEFLGCVLPTGNGALLEGGQTYFNSYEFNTFSCDGTINGVFHAKGTTSTRFVHNTITVGGSNSYIVLVDSSDDSNTGAPATGTTISDNSVYADPNAAAPAQAVFYLGGSPQMVAGIVRGNRLNVPSSWTGIKIKSGNNSSGLDIYDNQTVNGTPASNIFAAGFTFSSLQTFSGGITTTGSTLLDFSGSSGGIKFPSGGVLNAVTFSFGVTLSASVAINGGLTASGSTANDFSGSTGAFKLSTGAFTGSPASFSLTPAAAATDTAGATLTITGNPAGPVSASNGHTGGTVSIFSAVGVTGSGSFNGGASGVVNIGTAAGGTGTASASPGASSTLTLSTGNAGGQGGGAGNANTGNIVFNIGTPTGAGSYGQWQLQFGGSNHLTLNQTDTLQYSFQTGNKIFNITGAAADTSGVSWTLQGQQGGTASVSNGGTGGALTTQAGQGGSSNGTGTAGSGGVRTDLGGVGGNGSGAVNPGNGGQHVVAGGAAGAGGGGNANGGELDLRGGALSGTGTAGKVKIGDSNTSEVDVAATSGGKLGFFNVTAVVQQNTTGTTQQTSAGSGTAIKTDSTSTGGTGSTAYTTADVILALKHYGLLAPLIDESEAANDNFRAVRALRQLRAAANW